MYGLLQTFKMAISLNNAIKEESSSFYPNDCSLIATKSFLKFPK